MPSKQEGTGPRDEVPPAERKVRIGLTRRRKMGPGSLSVACPGSSAPPLRIRQPQRQPGDRMGSGSWPGAGEASCKTHPRHGPQQGIGAATFLRCGFLTSLVISRIQAFISPATCKMLLAGSLAYAQWWMAKVPQFSPVELVPSQRSGHYLCWRRWGTG